MSSGNLLTAGVWAVIGFLAGALPFSVWVSRLAVGKDARQYGDGNPGAASAWAAGTWRIGLPVLALDYFKGAVPVALAHYIYHVSGPGLAVVGLAPVVGHAFSPFLRFRGGKGITVTFGVWTGLLPPAAPIVLGLTLTALHFLRVNRHLVPILGMFGLLIYLLALHRDPFLLCAWLGNIGILAWKFRREIVGHMP